MTAHYHFLVGIIAVGLLTSCWWNNATPEPAALIRVNDQALSPSVFSNKLARRLLNYDIIRLKSPALIETHKSLLVQELIVELLIVQYLTRNNLVPSENELFKKRAKITSRFPTDATITRLLRKNRLTSSEWDASIDFLTLSHVLIDHLSASIEPLDENVIREFFDQNQERFRAPKQVYLRQIVVEQEADAKILSNALRQGRDFAHLAEKFSITPESQQGGTVGWIDFGTTEVFDQVFSLPLNQVSEVLQSPYGFHLVEVLKKQEERAKTFDEVRKQLWMDLMAQKQNEVFKKWLKNEFESSNIFVDYETISALEVVTLIN